MEDVQYLAKHGTLLDAVMLIDSSKRNKTLYVDPGQYQITFDQPFYNTTSVQILDASIPRTQYIINQNNNLLVYYWLDEGPNPQRHTFTFDVGDTDSDQFITTFNACGDIVLSNETLPAEQRSRFVFSAGRPFVIDALNSTCDVVIGMNTSAQAAKTFQANPGVPEYDNAGAVLCPFLNIDGSTSFFAGSEELLQQADGNSQINVFGSTPYVFQTQAANLTQCFVSVQGQTVLPGSTIIQATFTNDSAVLLDSNRNISVTTAVAAYQISDGTTTKTIPIKFRQDFENNPQMFKSISDGAGGYKLTGPNIASFIGEPYVTLSIEELDSHLTRGRSFQAFSLGIAKFQLGVQGYAPARFDYSNLRPVEFTPVGKLTTMTFTFYTASNLVYNFMGIDHTMTLLIRYYGMPAPEFDYKKLAPSYEPTQSGPDFQMNRVQQMFDDGESDNDDGM